MRISSFMYSIRQGIKNIKRNLLFSLASIGTIVSCLFLFGLFYCVIVNFRTAMTEQFYTEACAQDRSGLFGEAGEDPGISADIICL